MVRSISLAFAFITSCSQLPLSNTSICRGEFKFDRISSYHLRADAFITILQFIELDHTVAVVGELPVEPSALIIEGRGEDCDIFGQSFISSDMPEFQDLTYRRLQ